MSRIPHPEYRAWLAWKRDQLDCPDRSDQYLMQIAGEIHYVMGNKKWSPSEFRLKFQDTDSAMKRRTPEDAKRALARRRGEDI